MPGKFVERKTRGAAPARKPTRRTTPTRGASRPRSVATSAKSQAGATAEHPASKHRRRLVVFASLIGALTLTTALLHALAPAPLPPGAVQSLFAVGAPASMDAIFDTTTPVQPGRWHYIYVHQSKTVSGNAATLSDPTGGLADHFVIGNGDGCDDGEVQIGQRWIDQSPAVAPAGRSLRDDCISICLVGDFDTAAPTLIQERRLVQLLGALQSRANIPSSHIITLDDDSTPAGIGQYASASSIRRQLAARP